MSPDLRLDHVTVHSPASPRPMPLRAVSIPAPALNVTAGRRIEYRGNSVVLTAAEHAIVVALMRERGRCVAYAELACAAGCRKQSMQSSILTLRCKLSDVGLPSVISNVRRSGYVLRLPDSTPQ